MRRPLTVAVCVLVLASPAASDMIELKTGQRVEGTLKQATPASVSVDVAGQTITFEGEKVRAIYFGAAPASTVSAPSAKSAANQALDALRAINSVVTAGITYREYSARVLDGKVIVDRSLPDVPDQDLRRTLGLASDFYVIVSAAWSADISRAPLESYASAGRDPVLRECPAMWAQIEKADANERPRPPGMPPVSREARHGFSVAFRKQLLWSCASDKIADAEKLLGAAK